MADTLREAAQAVDSFDFYMRGVLIGQDRARDLLEARLLPIRSALRAALASEEAATPKDRQTSPSVGLALDVERLARALVTLQFSASGSMADMEDGTARMYATAIARGYEEAG